MKLVRNMKKFEVKIFNRNVPDAELLNDLKRVADELGNPPTVSEYQRDGKYGMSTIIRRFGRWQAALELIGKARTTNEEMLADIRRVAELLAKQQITVEEYRSNGSYNPGTIRSRFGTWRTATTKAGLIPGIEWGISEANLFNNLEKVWIKLGRQPRRVEMRKPVSLYSSKPYEIRYGSWTNALTRFSETVETISEETADEIEQPVVSNRDELPMKHRTKRDPGPRLTIRVWNRDGHTCVYCGRSPGNERGVKLHVDHIFPWSKGGETEFENLQTLCEKCNLGKGDTEQ